MIKSVKINNIDYDVHGDVIESSNDKVKSLFSNPQNITILNADRKPIGDGCVRLLVEILHNRDIAYSAVNFVTLTDLVYVCKNIDIDRIELEDSR